MKPDTQTLLQKQPPFMKACFTCSTICRRQQITWKVWKERCWHLRTHNSVMFNFSKMRQHIKFISTSFESAKTNTSLITLCLINLEINSHFLGKMSVPFGQPTWQFPSSHNFTGYKTWFCTFSSQQNSPRLQHMFPWFFPDISHTNSVWQTPSPTPKKERIWNDWGNIAK